MGDKSGGFEQYGPEHIADLRATLDELLLRWEQGPSTTTTRRGVRVTPARVKFIGTLAAHAHRLGRAVALLTDAGMHVETAPTVRSVYEHGLTLQWLITYGEDAMWAALNEALRQRRAVGLDLEKLVEAGGLESVRPVVAALLNAPPGDPSGADAQARAVKAMCDDIVRGDEFYFTYRTLSGFTHPGITVANQYVDSAEPPTIAIEPHPIGFPALWLYTTCCAVIWAARAVDILDGTHPNQGFLRAQARRLDIPDKVTLTDRAVIRRQKAERDRRLEQRRAAAAAPPPSNP